ncbi:MAG: CAP domain-containing protein [Caldilineaceae bacterium]
MHPHTDGKNFSRPQTDYSFPSNSLHLYTMRGVPFMIGCACLIIILCLTTAGQSWATTGAWLLVDSPAPVLEHPSSQEYPAVDGQRVVWQDARVGPTDIFLRTLDGSAPINLTESNEWEVQPAIDGDFVVWKDGYNGIGIHGINLVTKQRFTVTENKPDTSRPRLSGNIVVWADNRAGNDNWNIYGYNLTKQQEFVISDAPGSQTDPQIDGNLVVWWDYQERIYLYNLQTQQTQTILATHGARLPDVSDADHLVIWQDIRNGDWDIYGYDLDQQQEVELLVAPRDQEFVAIDQGLIVFQWKTEGGSWNIGLLDLATHLSFIIENNSSSQVQPAVDGALVVWQDHRYHQADIFYYNWSGTPPPPVTFPVAAPSNLQVGAFPDGAIKLRWEDHADNEKGLAVERTVGITGTVWSEIARLPANTTTLQDLPDLLGESYWYRVRAYNDEGYSAYSNDSFNSTFGNVLTQNERYLLTLINEARADPARFGYADYPPAPPLVYSPLLSYSAHSHSRSILNSAFQFGHCDPVGRCPGERALAVGYVGTCAENLTTSFHTGPATVEGANQGFLDSTGHRNSMLSPGFNEVGVGHVFDVDRGDEFRHGQITEVICGREGVKIPALPSGAVKPYNGVAATEFTYTVNFYSAEGYAPTNAQVIIDDVAHTMTLSTGKASLGAYRYTTRLTTLGQHYYYFHFDYGPGLSARWPKIGTIADPIILSEVPPEDRSESIIPTPHLYLPLVQVD